MQSAGGRMMDEEEEEEERRRGGEAERVVVCDGPGRRGEEVRAEGVCLCCSCTLIVDLRSDVRQEDWEAAGGLLAIGHRAGRSECRIASWVGSSWWVNGRWSMVDGRWATVPEGRRVVSDGGDDGQNAVQVVSRGRCVRSALSLC